MIAVCTHCAKAFETTEEEANQPSGLRCLECHRNRERLLRVCDQIVSECVKFRLFDHTDTVTLEAVIHPDGRAAFTCKKDGKVTEQIVVPCTKVKDIRFVGEE